MSEQIRVLVIGAGGREHALSWKISRSPMVSKVFAVPGNDGMRDVATVVPHIEEGDHEALLNFVSEESIDLVVIGPEGPLAGGLVDRMRNSGVTVFGPSADAARLEASKSFARSFMARHGVPHPSFKVFDDIVDARDFAATKDSCVVKADGLCAGKGVFVCTSREQTLQALDELMNDRRFGEAGDAVVIEDVLVGVEASFYVITDGKKIVTLPAAQDHKRLLDNDEGENTGGMGAYVPTPTITVETEAKILRQVVEPTLRGMRDEGMAYSGVLYIGLMVDDKGDPSVVEFNVRFGDPETQPLMLSLDSDLVPHLLASARGDIPTDERLDHSGAAVTVVLASGGYPRAYETGFSISGLDGAARLKDVVVFHAGTRQHHDGTWKTSGGRVLGVTARGKSFKEARERAYEASGKINFSGLQFRRDIGKYVQ